MQSAPLAPDVPQKSLLRISLSTLLPLLVTVLALFLLVHMSGEISVSAVRDDARGYSVWTLALALGAAATSYLFLSFYDVLILPTYSDVKVPTKTLMFTGASSLAVSNLFGFSWLTGGAIRLKIYTAHGVKIAAVAKLMATSWVAFFSGLCALIGSIMILNPAGFDAVTDAPTPYVAIFGLSLLGLLYGFLRWTKQGSRSVGIGPIKLELPRTDVGFKLTLVTVIELIATALTLYILFPADLTRDFAFFLGVFSIAIGAGILSHSPGGLGVFDGTIIAGFGASGRTDVLAAIALYRVIYTVIPAAIALFGIAMVWLGTKRNTIAKTGRRIHKTLKPAVPLIAAGTALSCGIVLLISGNLAPRPDRLSLLHEILPSALIETSHLFGSICGVLLMIIARALFQRMYRAWLLTIILVFLGFVVSLLKGFDWEEATVLAIGFGILWAFKSAFYRASFAVERVVNIRWILTVCTLVALISWVGIFATTNTQYTHELWWTFAWHGDASRVIRASVGITVVLTAILLNAVLTKETAKLRHMPLPETVLKLTRDAKHASAGLALTGDKRFIVTPDQKAYLAYADTGRSLICKGDPVGDKVACIAAIWQLRELADKMGRRCAFYGVSSEFLPTFLDLGHQILKIGEVARVKLQSFSLEGPSRKSWRNAKARINREGYCFEVIPAGQARPEYAHLKSISDAWLAHKGTHEKGFSLGWFDAAYLDKFDLGILRHEASGKIVAFANIMTSGDRSEVFVDLMRYDPKGPKRVMDALFAEMLLWAKANHFDTFSLGGSPLSGLEQHPLACSWHKIGNFLYRNGEAFYKFDGLRKFKEKFEPEWSPEYLTTASKLEAAHVLYEVSLLISRGAPDLRKPQKPKERTRLSDITQLRSAK